MAETRRISHGKRNKNRWNHRAAFDALRATWSPERVKEDEALLEQVFRLANDIPVLAEALAWARENDIEIFVDRQAENCGAYYKPGTGVIGVTLESILDPHYYGAVSIVHEIRHAWQDAQGLIADCPEDLTQAPFDFREFFIQRALVEADALAYGELARAQAYKSALTTRSRAVRPPAPMTKEAGENHLRRQFLLWFSKRDGHTQYYGDYLSKELATRGGLYDGSKPELNTEFEVPSTAARGINIHDKQALLRLGAPFTGAGNYLAQLPPDVLPKQIVRYGLADTFWGAATAEDMQLTATLRKAYLRRKLGAGKAPGP